MSSSSSSPTPAPAAVKRKASGPASGRGGRGGGSRGGGGGGGAAALDIPISPACLRRRRSLSESAVSNSSTSAAAAAAQMHPDPGSASAAEAAGQIINPDVAQIFRIVLTGGPCAGKTTCMARLKHFLSSRGFRVFVAPEAATMLFSAGVSFGDIAEEAGKIVMQHNLLKTQLHLEDSLADFARSTGKPSVILCDRGSMDGRAYVPDSVWKAVLAKMQTDNVTLRDTRYDAVLHMVTAAIGAEAHYGLENNATRSESIEEAAALDAKTVACWVGHPKVMTFNNSTPFEGKIRRVIRAVSRIIGFPLTKKQFKKFVLPRGFALPAAIKAHAEVFDVEKVYLDIEYPPGEQVEYTCIRRRKAMGMYGQHVAYGMTTLKKADGQEIELKRILTEREYNTLKHTVADPTRFVVRQRRTCFLHEGTFFQLDEYRQPQKVVGQAILSFQLPEGQAGGAATDMNFVKVERDVTKVKEFSAFQISLRDPSKPTKDSGAEALAQQVQ